MPEPENLVLVQLRELRTHIDGRFDATEKRLDRIEARMEMMHRNGEKALRGFIGHRAMVERTMASFEDEISSLRQRVERLETA